jgi:phosphatidylserine decarboxylase
LSAQRILIVQIGILALCLASLGEIVGNFPFPSPLIKPLLPPKLRWPDAQIAQWAQATSYDPGFLQFFMRDPERVVPPGDNLVSAADGVIKDIVFENKVTYFIIGLSFWDVHVVRSPAAGIVKRVEQEGISLYRGMSESQNQVFLKGRAGPVQQTVTLDTDYGEIKVRLITSYFASRLQVWAREGQKIGKGDRLGRILLGSTVVVEVPGDVKFSVPRGTRIVGGETIILKGRTPQ